MIIGLLVKNRKIKSSKLKPNQVIMKRIFLYGIISFFFNISFGQNPGKIQRGYAFFTSSTPGMIRVDDNGNQVTPAPIIERFIYVECPGTKMPMVSTVLYNKTAYTSTVQFVNETTVHAGKKNENGQEIVLNPKKGNRFWMIELQGSSGQEPKPGAVRNIIITSKAGTALYKFYLYKETQLQAPDRY